MKSKPSKCLSKSIATLIFSSACVTGHLHALPKGEKVAHGSAGFQRAGNSLTVRPSDNAVLNYRSFDIGSRETVRFIQNSKDSRVLNRVHDVNPTRIFGTLQSNGQVYLVNPFGVYFENGSSVNVGGLIAAAGKLSNRDFLAGRNLITGISGDVVNHGTITAAENLSLIGANVGNFGSLISQRGTVAMVAGDEVLIGERGGNIFVKTSPKAGTQATSQVPKGGVQNAGAIRAPRPVLAAGDLYSVAVSETGVIRSANTTLQVASGGAVRVAGTIDASTTVPGFKGGKIKLLADKGRVELRGATLDASGAAGGGTIVLDGGHNAITPTTVTSTGTILARGEGTGAVGGTVQILGDHVGLLASAVVDVSGNAGGGTALIGGDYQGRNPAIRNASSTYISLDVQIRADALSSGDGGKVIVWADEATRFDGTISARGGAQGGDGGFVEISGAHLTYGGKVDLSAPGGRFGTALFDPLNIVIDDQSVGPSPDDGEIADGEVNFANNAPGTFHINETAIEGFVGSVLLQARNSITLSSLTTDGVLLMGSGRNLTLQTRNNTIGNDSPTGGISFANTADTIRTQGSGTITIQAGVTADASGVVSARQGAADVSLGNLTTAGGAITVEASGDVIVRSNATLNAGTGTISLTADSAGTGTGTLTLQAGGSVNSTNTTTSAITLRGADISINTGGSPAGVSAGGAGGGVAIGGSLSSRPMSMGGAENAVSGVNLTDLELARINTLNTGRITFGDNTQTGDITFTTATPATTVGAAIFAQQRATGTGRIVLDDEGVGTALEGGSSPINLLAGTGGITAALPTNAFAEIATTGVTVTLNTTGGIGTAGNRIQFAALPLGTVVVGNTSAPATDGVFLQGLGSLTLGAITVTNQAVDIATLNVGVMTVTGTIATGTGPVTLSSVGAIVVNNALTTTGVGGTITINANTAGADGDGFTQGAFLISSGDTSANALKITVNDLAGATGGAQLGNITVAPGGSITVDTRGKLGVTGTGGSITQTVGAALNVGATGKVTLAVPTGGASGIGTFTDNILTTSAGGTVNLTAGSGGAFVTNTGNLILANPTLAANSPLSVISTGTLTLPAAAISTGTGDLTLRSNGGTLATAVALTTGSGNMTLVGSTGLTVSHLLTSGGGQINLSTTISGTVAVSAGGISSTSGSLTITSLDAVTVGTAINTGSGTIAINANTDGLLGQGFSQTAGGTITTTDGSAAAVAINVNAAGGGTGGAALRSIATGAGGTIKVATNTGGNTTGGPITQIAATLLNSGVGGTVALSTGGAASGIGASGTNILTTTDTITASSGTGGIFITETNGASFTANVTGASGDIALNSTIGTLNIGEASASGGGKITLSSADGVTVGAALGNGTTGDIEINANTGGDDAAGFTQNLGGTITTGSTGQTAVVVNVNTADSGTGGAVLRGIKTGEGGTIRVQTDAGSIQNTSGGSITRPVGVLDVLDSGTSGFVALRVGAVGSSIGTSTNPISFAANQGGVGALTRGGSSGGVYLKGIGELSIGTGGIVTKGNNVDGGKIILSAAGVLGLIVRGDLDASHAGTGNDGNVTFIGDVVTVPNLSISGETTTFNGRLSPGNDVTVGNLTVNGNLTFNPGSTLFVTLTSPANGNSLTSDIITVNSHQDESPSVIVLSVIVLGSAEGATLTGGLNNDPDVGRTTQIIVATNNATNTVTFAPSPNQFTNGEAVTIGQKNFSIAYNTENVTLKREETESIWTGGAGNNLWSDKLNWSAGVPGNGDAAIFQPDRGGSYAGTVEFNLGIDRALSQILFEDTVAPGTAGIFINQSGTHSIILGGGASFAILNETNTNTLNVPLVLKADSTFMISAGGLVFGPQGTIKSNSDVLAGPAGQFSLTVTGLAATAVTFQGNVGGTFRPGTSVTEFAAPDAGLNITAGSPPSDERLSSFTISVPKVTLGDDGKVPPPGATPTPIVYFNTKGAQNYTYTTGSIATGIGFIASTVTFTGPEFTAAPTKAFPYNLAYFVGSDPSPFSLPTQLPSAAGNINNLIVGGQNAEIGEVTFQTSGLNTVGAQVYYAKVMLTGDAVFAAGVAGTGNGVGFGAANIPANIDPTLSLAFLSTVDSEATNLWTLTANAPGNVPGRTWFRGSVGAAASDTELGTLTVGSGLAGAQMELGGGTAITVRTIGSQIYNDDVVLRQDTVLSSTGNGNVEFHQTVNSFDGTARALEVNTGGNTDFGDGGADYVGNLFNGLAGVTTDAGGQTRFAITPSATGTPSVKTVGNQIYNDDVVLRQNTVLASTGNGNVEFHQTVNSFDGTARALEVNTGGNTDFGDGGADYVGNLFNGLAGVTTDAGGQTRFAITPSATGTPSVKTVGNQIYNDDVVLRQDTVLSSTGNGNVEFHQTVNSFDGTARALEVNTGGNTDFGDGGADYVGNLFNGLAGVTTDAGGQTRFAITPSATGTPSVKTVGNQIYNDDVVLRQDTVLSSTGNGNVEFHQTVNSFDGTARALEVNTGGNTDFGDGGADYVGNLFNGLAGVTTDAGGQTRFAITPSATGTPSVKTVGNQIYNDNVVLRQDTVLASTGNGNVEFHQTVNSFDGTARALEVNTGGNTDFGDGGADYVGNLFNGLAGVTTDAGGQTRLAITPSATGTPSVKTVGNQIYNDDVVLRQDTVLASTGNGNVEFHQTVNSFDGTARALEVNTGGNTDFGDGGADYVGNLFNGLAGVTTDAGGQTRFAITPSATGTPSVKTVGNQIYNDDVVLRQNTVLASTGNGNVEFHQTVNSFDGTARALEVNTGGNTDFGDGGADYVGNLFNGLAGVTTDAGGQTRLAITPSATGTPSVKTVGNQIYNDDVVLRQDTVLASTGNGNVEFHQTVNSFDGTARALEVNTGGNTDFGDGGADYVGNLFNGLAGVTTDAEGQTRLAITPSATGTPSVKTVGNQIYNDDVVLRQDTVLASTGNGNVEFHQTVNSFDGTARALEVNTGGNTDFGDGGADYVGNLFNGLAGVTTDAGGQTRFAITPSATGTPSVKTVGNQIYNDNVVLRQDTVLASTGNGNVEFHQTVNSFDGTARALEVNTGGNTDFGDGGADYVGNLFNGLAGVTTDAGGQTRFAITPSATGTPSVKTVGNQIYNDDVVLRQDTVLASTGNGNVEFHQTVNSFDGTARALEVNTGGNTDFGDGGADYVGNLFNGLAGVTTDAGGQTRFAITPSATGTPSVKTVGNQIYNDDVVLRQNTVLASTGNGNVEFHQTVNSFDGTARALEVNTGGNTDFGDGGADYVGNLFNGLAGVTTDAGGQTRLAITPSATGTPSVKTVGNQIYNDDVVLRQDTVLASTGNGNVEFHQTVNSFDGTARALEVNTGGNTDFGDGGADYVGNLFNGLAGVTTDAGGQTRFAITPSATGTPSVKTVGNQIYNDDVVLRQNTVLASTGNGNVEFHQTVNSFDGTARALEVNTGGNTDFGDGGADYVGNLFNGLAGVTTDAGGQTRFAITPSATGTPSVRTIKVVQDVDDVPKVVASGAQTYSDAVVLLQDTVLKSDFASTSKHPVKNTIARGGTFRFGSTVDSSNANARNLTVTTAGRTRFTSSVGAGHPLNYLIVDSPRKHAPGDLYIGAGGGTEISIVTTGAQKYKKPVFLANSAKFEIKGEGKDANISFSSTIESRPGRPRSLAIVNPNKTIINDSIGSKSNLLDLKINEIVLPRATIIVNTRLVKTEGDQFYGSPIWVNNNISELSLFSNSGSITLAQSMYNELGESEVGGSVVVSAKTGGITLGGSAVSDSISIVTKGSQTYDGNISIIAEARITSQGAQTYNGNLEILKNATMTSQADQSYNGNLAIGNSANVELKIDSTTGVGAIAITGTIEGPGGLTINSSRIPKADINGKVLSIAPDYWDIVLNGAVDGVSSLNVTGFNIWVAGVTSANDIVLTGSNLLNLAGNNYLSGGNLKLNPAGRTENSKYSTIVAGLANAPTSLVKLEAGGNFTMGMHEKLFVRAGSLTITGANVTLGDVAAPETLTIAWRGSLIFNSRLVNNPDNDALDRKDQGLSIVASNLIFKPGAQPSGLVGKAVNVSDLDGRAFQLSRASGIRFFKDENVAEQFNHADQPKQGGGQVPERVNGLPPANQTEQPVGGSSQPSGVVTTTRYLQPLSGEKVSVSDTPKVEPVVVPIDSGRVVDRPKEPALSDGQRDALRSFGIFTRKVGETPTNIDITKLTELSKDPTVEEEKTILERLAIFRQPWEGQANLDLPTDYEVVLRRVPKEEIQSLLKTYEGIVGPVTDEKEATQNELRKKAADRQTEIKQLFARVFAAKSDTDPVGAVGLYSLGSENRDANASVKLLQRIALLYRGIESIGLTPKEIEISELTIVDQFFGTGDDKKAAEEIRKLIQGTAPEPKPNGEFTPIEIPPEPPTPPAVPAEAGPLPAEPTMPAPAIDFTGSPASSGDADQPELPKVPDPTKVAAPEVDAGNAPGSSQPVDAPPAPIENGNEKMEKTAEGGVQTPTPPAGSSSETPKADETGDKK